MSRRPFDPGELDQPSTDAGRAIFELERYVATTATDAPRGLEDRVMAAVELEAAPRRGFLVWLLTPTASGSGLRRFARASALAATLVLAVAGALFAGQLADVVRNIGSGSTPTHTPSESVVPTPTESIGPSPSSSEEASPKQSESPEPSASPGASGGGAGASATGTADESNTARPSATPTPTATPEPPHT